MYASSIAARFAGSLGMNFLSDFLGAVHHDRGGLRHGDLLPARALVVDDHRDRRHRVERQELRRLLLAFSQVDGMPVVLQAAFLERDASAHSVRSAGCVEIDHGI